MSPTVTPVQPRIHPTALIDPLAQVDEGVSIGPFCIVEAHTVIGAGTTLEAHVHVRPYVTLGSQCVVATGAVLGGDPQDAKFKGEESFVVVGDRTRIGEYVTLHRATGEGQTTRIGDDCFLMAYSHVGHNSELHNRVTLANGVQIAGHVVVEEGAVLGGLVAIHQHCRVGAYCMVGGGSACRQDIPPYVMADGSPTWLIGLNLIGLRRNQFASAERLALKRTYRQLFFEANRPWSERLADARANSGNSEAVANFLDFIECRSKRGICSAKVSRADRKSDETSQQWSSASPETELL